MSLAQEDAAYLDQAFDILKELEDKIRVLEIETRFDTEVDVNDAILTINSGAGGTESCDFASMLARMYQRYADKKQLTFEILHLVDGTTDGIKSITMRINGKYAYGLLKNEIGVHRLQRVSPFGGKDKVHTSFVSVYVSPIVDDSIEIEILDKDLEEDTYRSSGKGGQHVNKTDSAVRIRHLPTGIVVACQTQRSQPQNRSKAMEMLRSKLYDLKLQEQREKLNQVEDSKNDASFGNQIRSYIFHPQQMVKDHRTNIKIYDIQEFLDGNLELMEKMW